MNGVGLPAWNVRLSVSNARPDAVIDVETPPPPSVLPPGEVVSVPVIVVGWNWQKKKYVPAGRAGDGYLAGDTPVIPPPWTKIWALESFAGSAEATMTLCSTLGSWLSN